MATTNSSKTAVNETSQNDSNCTWTELKLLRLIVLQNRLVLQFMDNFLWTIEKCTEWSLPRQDVEDEKDSKKTKLVRPLPWLLFLPSLLILRIIRGTVNIGTFILGCPQITPSEMIKFVQKSRRCLHAAMKKENKERSECKDKRSSMSEAKKALIRSIRLTLSSLSCLDASKPSLSPPPIKIYVSSILDPDPETTTSEEKPMTKSTASTAESNNLTSESKEEKEEKEETLNEMIDRLALENSEDDENFEPPSSSDGKSDGNDDENSDDSDDSDDSNVSSEEIKDIIKDATLHRKNPNNVVVVLTSTLDFEEESVKQDDGKRSSAKESHDKIEECLAALQRIDSLRRESYTPNRSSQEGDPTFYSPISSDSDAPKEYSVSITEQCISRKILETINFINGEVRFITASRISESESSGQSNNL